MLLVRRRLKLALGVHGCGIKSTLFEDLALQLFSRGFVTISEVLGVKNLLGSISKFVPQ